MPRATGPDRTARTAGMTRATWTRGRRGAVTAASAAVVCLGGVLAACGGGNSGGGYVAVGAGSPRDDPSATAPTGSVTFVPLDGANGEGGANSSEGTRGSGRTGASGRPGTAEGAAPDDSVTPDAGGDPGTPGAGGGSGTPSGGATPGGPGPGGGGGGRTTPAPGPSGPAPSRTASPSPADLSWGDPATAAADRRWCQKVTVAFHNSGGTAVRSGSVTFGTHIIGALGIDWGTVESTVDLPAPIGPGAHEKPTWTLCVDTWRVPLGMHIETRDVSVRWE
ncbi:hypothetical protein AB0N17_39120 [Streptomyces sp. NPDC051133]|uniref:hypothetical protein n=1 Tax=Streptomyces sp. NPDC051133 TaxID=3155521 RepID=UPI00343CA6D2